MGNGATAHDKRQTALAIEGDKVSKAVASKYAVPAPDPKRRPEKDAKPLSLQQLAEGERRVYPCKYCGAPMRAVELDPGNWLFKCPVCVNVHETAQAAPGGGLKKRPTLEDHVDSRKPSKDGFGLPATTMGGEDDRRRPSMASGSAGEDSRRPSKQSGVANQTGPRASPPLSRAGSKQSALPPSASRQGSKQSAAPPLASLAPVLNGDEPPEETDKIVVRHGKKQALTLQRRASTGVTRLNSEEAMGGFYPGDMVVFREQDATAKEFGIGIVLGGTKLPGVVEVSFASKDDRKFNFKAEGLMRLDRAMEKEYKAGRLFKPSRVSISHRSTIG